MSRKIITTIISLILTFGTAKAVSATSHREGEIINDRGTLFLIKNSGRFGFRTAEEFFSYGYTFDMAVPASEADLALPYTSDMKARTGSLARDTRDNSTCYLVFDTGIRKLDINTIYLLGMYERKIYEINLRDYPASEDFALASGFEKSQPGTLINDNGEIELVTAEGRAPFATAAIFKSYGYDFQDARVANSEDVKMQKLPALPFRDGSLVNDHGTIFLISQGWKFGFKTWQGFISRGYKITAVIDDDTSKYAQGENFE